MGNQRTPGLIERGGLWHIDKMFRGARICESTGTSDLARAERYLAKRIALLRETMVFGAPQDHSFRAAATKYLSEHQHKRSLERDARALASLDPFIGSLPLKRVHHETLQPFVRARLEGGISPGTINRDLAVVRRILNLSARLWRDQSDQPWLRTAPLIQMERHPNKRDPYPLSIEEERPLFSELDGHLANMALFKVNTGLREQEAGTGNIADAVGLGAALEYLSTIGMPNIEHYEAQLLSYATERLMTVPGLKILGTAAQKASVLSFVIDGLEPTAIGSALNQEGIAVRTVRSQSCVASVMRPPCAHRSRCTTPAEKSTPWSPPCANSRRRRRRPIARIRLNAWRQSATRETAHHHG